MRIVYFGSSEFSMPGLQACLTAPGYELAGVITTPPQKQGRGLELSPTVVAQFCAERGLRYREFARLDETALQEVALWKPDVFVVASYGKIIPENFLKLASLRFNIHPSLLPKYRGASPLNAPILNGDTCTGLCIADVTKALDAGDLYYCEKINLTASDTSEEIGRLLAEKSKTVMLDLLKKALQGLVPSVPQSQDGASYASKLKKEDGRLHLHESAEIWDRKVRGLKPWPGAFAEIHDERLSVLELRIKDPQSKRAEGTLLEITPASLVLQTACGSVELLKVKPAGRKEMSGGDYARGRRWTPGMSLA